MHSSNTAIPLSCFPEFLQMAVNFEDCRKKWLQAGEELVSSKEMLAKAETERGALEVKLKHARNQVDVEIRRRQKAEAVYEKLVSATLFFFFLLFLYVTSRIADVKLDGERIDEDSYSDNDDAHFTVKITILICC